MLVKSLLQGMNNQLELTWLNYLTGVWLKTTSVMKLTSDTVVAADGFCLAVLLLPLSLLLSQIDSLTGSLLSADWCNPPVQGWTAFTSAACSDVSITTLRWCIELNLSASVLLFDLCSSGIAELSRTVVESLQVVERDLQRSCPGCTRCPVKGEQTTGLGVLMTTNARANHAPSAHASWLLLSTQKRFLACNQSKGNVFQLIGTPFGGSRLGFVAFWTQMGLPTGSGRRPNLPNLPKSAKFSAKPLAFASLASVDVFINQERKLGARRRLDTVLVSTINDAD